MTAKVLLYGKKTKQQAGGQSHPGKAKKYIQKQEASSVPGQGPGSIVVLLLDSACSVSMAFTGMKQF